MNDYSPFTYKSEATLLECMEQNGVEITSHCRDGFCGACRTQLKQGEVKYLSAPLAFINDDEILPCCSIPKTDIELKVGK